MFVVTGIVYTGLAWFLVHVGGSRRLVAAFLLAPLAPSIVIAGLAQDIRYALVVAPFSYAFALPGIPAYFVLRRCNWLRIWHVVLCGAILGGLVAFAAGLSHFICGGALLFAGYGALTGLVFWLIAFAKRAA